MSPWTSTEVLVHVLRDGFASVGARVMLFGLAVDSQTTTTKSDRARILVIDDEPAVRRLVTRTLEWAGFTVFAATNGREGLEWLEREQADLIVLDMNMPVVDGPSFLFKLMETHRLLPVIATSGYRKVAGVEGYSGPLEYLGKPYRPAELVTRVETMLGLEPQGLTRS